MAATKPQRSMKVIETGDKNAVVKVSEGKKSDLYEVEEIPAAFGRGFVVTKNGDRSDHHQLNVDGIVATCSCPAGTYRGICRHLDFVRVLINRNII